MVVRDAFHRLHGDLAHRNIAETTGRRKGQFTKCRRNCTEIYRAHLCGSRLRPVAAVSGAAGSSLRL
jgi:hypothetical protein